MAEFVQQNIEEMLPELEQMERVGLFTKSETRKILKKRKNYEYKLRRQQKEKEDFLQYIQYELNVLTLIKKRRQRLGCTYKKFEIDVSIIQRVHKLFRIACARFREDVKLWLSHVEFAKKRKEKATISRIFAKMLQVHNRKPDLWILAAKWEFETHNNTSNARGLMQRGLRFNPDAKHMWIEYFRLELLNADKLRKRREVLGLAAENEDENEEMAAEVSDQVLAGKVAQIVFKEAIAKFTGDVSFCLEFLHVSKLFNFTKELQEDIFTDLKTNYGDSPQTWDALARQCADQPLTAKTKKEQAQEKIAHENEACAVYQEAIKRMPNAEMWSHYLKFSLERIELAPNKVNLTNNRRERALELFKAAQKLICLSEDLYLQWINLLVTSRKFSKALKVSNKAVVRIRKSVRLWKMRLQCLIRCETSEDLLFAEMEKSLSSVDENTCLPILQLMIEWAIFAKSERLQKIFEMGMAKKKAVSCPIKECYADWLALTKGSKKVHAEYDRMSKVKPTSADLFRKFISYEMSRPKSDIVRIRKTYESALTDFGEIEIELWLDYIKLELTHPSGEPKNASKIHWRAMKQLDGDLTESFVSQYSLLQTGLAH